MMQIIGKRARGRLLEADDYLDIQEDLEKGEMGGEVTT